MVKDAQIRASFGLCLRRHAGGILATKLDLRIASSTRSAGMRPVNTTTAGRIESNAVRRDHNHSSRLAIQLPWSASRKPRGPRARLPHGATASLGSRRFVCLVCPLQSIMFKLNLPHFVITVAIGKVDGP
jgi:hypothetical protein